MGQAAAKKTVDKGKEVPELKYVVPELKDVTINGVVTLDSELGRGAFGSVFKVKYRGMVFAAKKIHPILIENVSSDEKERIKSDFIRECLCCSSFRHPNIVQFVGVYYHSSQSSLPIMVMELMEISLAKFLDNNKARIAIQTKMSILYDVSRGLRFLHNHKPQILHRDLSSNNVMLTRCQIVAKIGDLGVAKVIRADTKQTKSKLTTAPGTLHFMPPEALVDDNPVYGTPIDVFSFGGIALHVFSEEWPTPTGQKVMDPVTEELVALSEAKRRQKYFDTMTGRAAILKDTVERCLSDNPKKRPPIQEVSTYIESLKESLSFAEALQSHQYHINWTSCSDLPCKLYSASVALSAAGDTVYVTAGSAPDYSTYNKVYCYNTNTDHWTLLPQPGHHCGVLHMLDNRLTIFGGIDPYTKETLNQVTTYDNGNNSWYNHYSNMLYKRFKPGVVAYNDYVIIMGGMDGPKNILDTIEIMNFHKHQLEWKSISVHLPVPMWNIKPTISADNIIIVGYNDAGGRDKGCYQIAIEDIITSLHQPPSITATSNQWKKMSPATHYNTVTVPYTNPPVVIGGSDNDYIPTCDITLYDASKNLWVKVDALTRARCHVGVGLLNNNSIIIIGGTSGGSNVEAAQELSLSTVEIGNIVPNQYSNAIYTEL